MFNIRDIRGILTRRNEQSRSSDPVQPKTPEEEIENSASSAEGFLCPHCFLAFPTADALQNHYESSHSEGINDVGDGRNMFNCPACKMKLGSEIELQSHYTRHHSGSKEDLELEAMHLQVKALEEGKALLQSELQAMRMQSSEIMKENAKIREERDALEYKAAKLAGELADLKADLDELKTKKLSTESALKLSEEKIHKLEVEMQQRPEADDVSLLQQELVSVQKMMDQLTLQREAEKDTLQKQCNNLKETCLKLQERKTELEGILKSCPKKEELESLQEKISQMSITISQLQKDVQVKEVEKSKLLISLEKYENYDEIKAQLSETQSNLAEMQRLSSEKDSLIIKLKNELKTVKENVEEMKVGREQLFSKIEEGEGANAAMLQLKEENARLQEQFLHQQTLYGQIAHETESKMGELRSSLKMAMI
ncbi:early endosome antigen 1-like [Stegodyphus dumicola]|uniref:early endosome antigen 1-like n=1 Tax=Stegodyphus dumicola TaxID=202533 RepID=UPI0015B35624|nr:early endosome antigen 1-like [Stegodyphus dumicola]